MAIGKLNIVELAQYSENEDSTVEALSKCLNELKIHTKHIDFERC